MTGTGPVLAPVAARTGRLALLALLTMTAAWGSTFFLIKDLVTRVPVPDLLALRFGVAAVVVAALGVRSLRMSRRTVINGVLLGLLYGGAQILQTAGLARTTASVSGFLTGLYVVATPLLGAVVLRVRIRGTTWLAVGLATVGLAVLSLHGLSLGAGELLTVASAIVYAVQILAMSRMAEPHTAVSLTIVQLAVIAVVCALAAAPGGFTLPVRPADWWSLAYLAVVAGALTMFLQTWAQAHVDASYAAVAMALEPVWAAAFAVALGGEAVTVRMVVGGVSILAAMLLVELGPRLRRATTGVLG